MSDKNKYRITDQEKAFRNQANDYDSEVFTARGCAGFFIGTVLVIIAVCIFPNISGKYLLMLFLFGLIGVPYYMYSTEKEKIKQATDEAEYERQKEANERRVARKCREYYSNAPTTLIANSIKYNEDLRKDAVKAKSYIELVQIQKDKNLGTMIWKNENVSISLSDERLNVIELDALVKQTNKLLSEENNKLNNNNKKQENNIKNNLHNNDIAKQLRELKALLDEDLITKEDFENKKKQLLNL